jgi:hypothetical protein
MREALVMKDLRHPNLLQLQGVILQQQPLSLVRLRASCNLYRQHCVLSRSGALPK